MNNKFNYIDRGYDKVMVLIPGWATDYRIYDELDLSYNYLVPGNFNPYTFPKALMDELDQRSIENIVLFGWSLGGFVAAQCVPFLKDKIEKLILVSVRRQYDSAVCAQLKELLRTNAQGYLYQFTTQCFYNKIALRHFRKKYLKLFLDELPLTYLQSGLQYLSERVLAPVTFTGARDMLFIHGVYDAIAPIEEVRELVTTLPQARLIELADAGHIPFLECDFKELLNEE